MSDVLSKLKGCVSIANGRVQVKDAAAVRGLMDGLIYEAVFDPDEEKRKSLQRLVIEIAKKMGADVVINAKENIIEQVKKNNNGKLADLVILCTGAPSAAKQALASVAAGGTILFFCTN